MAPAIRRLTADNAKATQAAEQRAQQQRPVVLYDPRVHHAGAAQRRHPLCGGKRGDAAKTVCRGHLHQPAHPTLLTCAAGSFILEGNWFFTVLTGIVLFSFVGILFFNRTKFIAWAHKMKDKHTKKSRGVSLGFSKTSPSGKA